MPSYTEFETSEGTFARSNTARHAHMSSFNFCEALARDTGDNWKMVTLDDVGCSRSAPDRWWNCASDFLIGEIFTKTGAFRADGLDSLCNGWHVVNDGGGYTGSSKGGLVDIVPKGDYDYLGIPTNILCKKK